MADRVNVRITMTTTDAADGSEFDDFSKGWQNLPLADYVRIERILHDALGQCVTWAEESVKGGKRK
jgi:hypothetical protein